MKAAENEMQQFKLRLANGRILLDKEEKEVIISAFTRRGAKHEAKRRYPQFVFTLEDA